MPQHDPIVSAPVLSEREVLSRLGQLPEKAHTWRAMYNSVLGGVVLDPRLFFIPIDDHMCHRGHAVFDTANVAGGCAYGLDFHLDRLLRGAEIARIPHTYTKEQLREIILKTIAASGMRENVLVRYWLSAGRGNFWVTPTNCTAATFYVVVHDYNAKELVGGGEAVVLNVPLKPPLLATVKSNNYLLNALTAMEAEARGGTLGIQVDQEGYVTEASIGNVAIVDENGVLRTREFDCILAGTTVKRAFVLAPQLLRAGLLEGFEFSKFTVVEMERASEVMTLGGGGLSPVTNIGGKPIGNGEVGPVATALHELLVKDMHQSEYLDEIPYADYFDARRAYEKSLPPRRRPSAAKGSANNNSSADFRASNRQSNSDQSLSEGSDDDWGSYRFCGFSVAGLLAASAAAFLSAALAVRLSAKR